MKRETPALEKNPVIYYIRLTLYLARSVFNICGVGAPIVSVHKANHTAPIMCGSGMRMGNRAKSMSKRVNFKPFLPLVWRENESNESNAQC